MHALRTDLLTGLFFVGFVLVYFAAYLLVIERVKDMSPWIPTMLFVFPAMYVLSNGVFLPLELRLGHLIGMPYLPKQTLRRTSLQGDVFVQDTRVARSYSGVRSSIPSR